MDGVLAQPGILFTVATFVVVIGLLVFVHEFGHYIVGRWFGVKADTFAIGFGREIAGWTDSRGTRWKVGLLPLGGYVKFAGDLNAASQPDPALSRVPTAEREGYFHFRPIWQRALIILAGPFTNFAFAIVIFAVLFTLYGQTYTPAVLDRVVPGSPAAAAGLLPGDRVERIDGDRIQRFEDIIGKAAVSAGEPMRVEVTRGGRDLSLTVVPRVIEERDRFGNEYKRGLLGVASGRPVVEARNPASALWFAARETVVLTKAMAGTLWQVISGRRAISELGGPIKIAQFSGQQASLGLHNFVTFMALVSINLGFMNLLPVPMLDGGHLFLYAVEAVRRRPLGQRVQEWAFMSGFVALISLMVILTWHDLASVGVWRHLAGLLG